MLHVWASYLRDESAADAILCPDCNWPAGQIPPIYRDKEGYNYVKTKAGNFAMVSYDPSGRMFMIDEGGTLYYDTGEPSLGIYIVRPLPLLPPLLPPLSFCFHTCSFK